MKGDLRSDSYVLLAGCSEYVHECVNRSGVGVNAQMRPVDSRTLTRQRESKRGGGGGNPGGNPLDRLSYPLRKTLG